ncbi:uncharacterized protein LOC130803237 [Amaranthus tricolor]|uniref:uncharacterized protein LOC130803237 n=1 Tax=Amaranthus tricolor TaxID=29722 RepID=UPI002587D0D2|nr:uncharacterized protein LOC130803237 [Amaranthus tricolor]
MELVTKQFEEQLKGKKYILVLDDLWNEDRKKWVDLERFLKWGHVGSRILISYCFQGGCSNLRGFPKEFCKLVKLRHLNLNGCNALTHMPLAMDKLTNLRLLPVKCQLTGKVMVFYKQDNPNTLYVRRVFQTLPRK